MKVGIVTIVDYTNYGNRLQNYALSHLLRTRFGCDAVTLAARPEKPFENGNHILWLKNLVAGQLCRRNALAEQRFGSNMTRWANFRNWSRKIPTRTFYDSPHLPERLNEEFDLFLAGSDQIWNYRFSSSRFDDFFLRFAPEEKRAALCASFGVDSIPEEWKQAYIDGLSGFRHISVREEVGREIIRDLLGREVPVLIDPAMMLTPEEWLRVAKKPRADCSKPYVLKYYLGDDRENPVESWAKENGFEVYELLNGKIPELYSAGPGEFLSLIQNAALVCSDSFHCIVFSILFSRPFVVFARQGKEDYMSSRLTTLLDKFGFQHRWSHLMKPEDYLHCSFSQIPEILETERQKFLDYLNTVLKEG